MEHSVIFDENGTIDRVSAHMFSNEESMRRILESCNQAMSIEICTFEQKEPLFCGTISEYFS